MNKIFYKTYLKYFNIHSTGDLAIILAKVINSKNKFLGMVSGVISLLIWIYTRNILQLKFLIQDFKKLNQFNDIKLRKNFFKSILIFILLMGGFFTTKVLQFFIKEVKKNEK